ncbi:hypothetical protein [Hymenobacter sp. DG25A]|uniref:hypothetical protein n=1 Tax=Hymenobacter sp. DG25A TaxID=1385663 RepID=UPI000A96E916|nr:hypothetical protein [Hymenobacter sp. DG25A]
MYNYKVTVFRYWIFVLIFFSSIVLLFGGVVLIGRIFHTGYLAIFWICLCLGMGYYLIKIATVNTLQVTLSDSCISIGLANSVNKEVLLLKDIESYKYQNFNGNSTFRIRLRSGKKITLIHNVNFCPSDDMRAFVDQFELIRTTLASADSNNIIIRREKTFFEKPLANVIGWLVSGGLVYFTWYLITHGVKDGKWGSVLLGYGNGMAYLGAWLDARRGKSDT